MISSLADAVVVDPFTLVFAGVFGSSSAFMAVS
jgi:hypothetical protein